MKTKLVKKQEGTMDNIICYPLNLIVHEKHNISVLHSICYKTALSHFGLKILEITAA